MVCTVRLHAEAELYSIIQTHYVTLPELKYPGAYPLCAHTHAQQSQGAKVHAMLLQQHLVQARLSAIIHPSKFPAPQNKIMQHSHAG